MAIRVRVYRNLHNNKRSVVNTKTGRVIMHADEIRLRGVQWRVQPAGNAKVRIEGKKNIHAYAVSIIDSLNLYGSRTTGVDWHRVRYNPYIHDSFQKVLGNAPDEPIDSSYFAEFTSGGYAYVSCEGC